MSVFKQVGYEHINIDWSQTLDFLKHNSTPKLFCYIYESVVSDGCHGIELKKNKHLWEQNNSLFWRYGYSLYKFSFFLFKPKLEKKIIWAIQTFQNYLLHASTWCLLLSLLLLLLFSSWSFLVNVLCWSWSPDVCLTRCLKYLK